MGGERIKRGRIEDGIVEDFVIENVAVRDVFVMKSRFVDIDGVRSLALQDLPLNVLGLNILSESFLFAIEAQGASCGNGEAADRTFLGESQCLWKKRWRSGFSRGTCH